ncbi:hypothetical protein DERF_008085 [Dermatophagoides farinae]|uniref:Uncharacterized protein n=1 Tax=Dermatophagoides farinae TaxID=6954 RepID=A0A922L6M3_DERFA|nr:hypothetical protein DERF_008085 [Dermatophagoides farinae]
MHLHALMFFLHFSLAKLNTNSPSQFEFVWRELTCHKLIDDYDGDDDMKERDDSGAMGWREVVLSAKFLFAIQSE